MDWFRFIDTSGHAAYVRLNDILAVSTTPHGDTQVKCRHGNYYSRQSPSYLVAMIYNAEVGGHPSL